MYVNKVPENKVWASRVNENKSFMAKGYANKSQARGFTLIEIILALGLTTLLLGLLSTGMYIVAEDWNRNADVLDETLDEALAVLQVDRALHGIMPHSYTNIQTLSREIFFEGEDDELAFVSTVSPQREPGLTAWRLSNVRDEGVYVTLVPAFADNPQERLDDAEGSLLLPGYSVSFNYLYEDNFNIQQWTDKWIGRELLQLPFAVYVRFEPFSEEQELLEVVAPIRAYRHRQISPNQARIQGL